MKFFDNNKKQTDNSIEISEKKNQIEKNVMKLADEELSMIASGQMVAEREDSPSIVLKKGDGPRK